MVLPDKPVTLTPEQIADLNKQLSTMRHDINNNLSLIMAAVELARLKPEAVPRMINTLADQPAKVTETMRKFSVEFEQILGITR
jgi:hypothetical protein